ncbi:jg2971 [Pararge aegeria aegeria]|uniref:Jg2971 protein n=1 Tax=Pararge aegeria aegeria TaxID=348720 RepID=A0A8S4RGJ1_9NEOP|nr:jg2971 [Pararge aegeria aegeria]
MWPNIMMPGRYLSIDRDTELDSPNGVPVAADEADERPQEGARHRVAQRVLVAQRAPQARYLVGTLHCHPLVVAVRARRTQPGHYHSIPITIVTSAPGPANLPLYHLAGASYSG